MDLDGTIFWYVAGALVLAALVISFIGIRGKDTFPPNSMQMRAGIGVFAVLVVGACLYGVANAAEEKEHRDEELAAEEAEAEEAVAAEESEAPPEVAPSQAEGGQPPGSGTPPEPVAELALNSPEDGSLVFDPGDLSAQAGMVTLAYANPSPVPHNVAIEDNAGTVLAESEDITAGEVSIEADLVPGEYIYFCSVPGHRESGMEGTLTVDSDSATSN